MTEVDEGNVLMTEVTELSEEVKKEEPNVEGEANASPNWVNVKAAKKRMWAFTASPKSKFGVDVNPVVTVLATVFIWGFVIATLVDPDAAFATLFGGKLWVDGSWTWLLLIARNVWILMLLFLVFSKHGNLVLGKPGEKPEFTNVAWFTMLFCAGIGNELLFFGVMEPIYQYTGVAGQVPARFSDMGRNDRAQWALSTVFYHWGLHAWSAYAIVGMLLAILAYRKDLPLTIRTTLYPLIGDKAYGFAGDIIDLMTVASIMIGITVALGLGIADLTSGLQRLTGCASYASAASCAGNDFCSWGVGGFGGCKHKCDWLDEKTCGEFALDTVNVCRWYEDPSGDTPPECIPQAGQQVGFELNMMNQLLLIAAVTLVAGISVLTGLKGGIKYLSMLAFISGAFIWLYIFLADSPWYFLDTFSQQLGLYLQWFLKMGTATDAFARHNEAPEAAEEQGASALWMSFWTLFYSAAWIAWSPFVGMFIAQISRGRTIREFIIGTMTMPVLYMFTWFTVFGAAGIRMEIDAEHLGITGSQSPSYVKKSLNLEGVITFVMPPVTCTNYLESPDYCQFVSRLSQRSKSSMLMDVLSQYGDMHYIMVPIALLAITLYFVTSSDSGSMVVNSICANGRVETPAPQKIYWCLTLGAVAMAFTVIGFTKDDKGTFTLTAVFYAAIITGLPYCMLLLTMTYSLWKAIRYESGDVVWSPERFFKADLSDVIDVKPNMEYLTKLGRVLLAVVEPFSFLSSSSSVAEFKFLTIQITMRALFYLWVLLALIGGLANVVPALSPAQGLFTVSWFFYLCFAGLLSKYRLAFRVAKNVDGNFLEDIFVSCLAYPLVAEQLDAHMQKEAKYTSIKEEPAVPEE